MDPHPAEAPEPVLLIIADISGYTRYMTANAKTLAHSQTIITELVTAIVRQIELPLEIAKLEGDAVFLYCRKQRCSRPWPETRQIIGRNLFTFFRMFGEKIGELSRSTTCTCNACTHIEKLRLKVIVHSGEALFHRVLNFVELAGVDVIIVHRLLKNSVSADQYLLLTEAARQDVEFPEPVQLGGGVEIYDDIGPVNTLVYLPDGARTASSAGSPAHIHADKTVRAPTRFSQSWKLFCKLWFAPFVRRRKLAHVTSETSAAGRTGFAMLTLLLTPFYLPVGTLFVVVHALREPAEPHHHEDDHEHKPDGSCCGGH